MRTNRKKRGIVPSGHNMPASLLAGKRFFQRMAARTSSSFRWQTTSSVVILWCRTGRKKRGIVPNGHNMPASPLAGKRFFQRTTRRASSSFRWQTTSNVVILWCRTGRKKRDIVPSGHNMPASLLAGKRFFQCNDDVTRRHYTRFPTPSSAPRGPRFSPQAPRSAPSAGYTPVPSPDPPPARAGPRSPPRAP